MWKIVTMLAAVVSVCVAENAYAQSCPISLYGQWNGIYYYFCTPQGDCSNMEAGSTGHSTTLKQCGCNPQNSKLCLDPIRLLAAKARPGEEVKLNRYMKPKPSGGMAGQGSGAAAEVAESTFLVLNAEKAKHRKESDTVVLKVEAKGGSRYFRTLHIKVDGIKDTVYLGQEIEKTNAPEKPTTASFKTGSTAGFEHDLEAEITVESARKKVTYHVLTATEMTP